MAHKLYIDTTTSSQAELTKRIKAMPETISVTSATYTDDPTLSLVTVRTQLDEYQMDEWLYAQKGVDVISVSASS